MVPGQTVGGAPGVPVRLVLAAPAGGTALLRLTGIIRLPDDNAWSVNYFDDSLRDGGVRLPLNCGAPLTGTAAALVRGREGG